MITEKQAKKRMVMMIESTIRVINPIKAPLAADFARFGFLF